MNKKVTDILLRKGSSIISVIPNSSVLEALQIMADKNIGSVMVMDNGKYLGMMTERDYSRKIVLQGNPQRIQKFSKLCRPTFPG